jgi:hypothetical protein
MTELEASRRRLDEAEDKLKVAKQRYVSLIGDARQTNSK